MQVDFYQLSRDPVERVVPLLAAKVLDSGVRLLVVYEDGSQRGILSQALWERDGTYLAHDEIDSAYADRQPILLSGTCDATNGATIVLLADGIWRDGAEAFARAILLFGSDQTAQARTLWTTLGTKGHDLRIFKQHDGGGWREGA